MREELKHCPVCEATSFEKAVETVDYSTSKEAFTVQRCTECSLAPVIVDPEQDEVYFTPLYDVMCHFSKFIRPGATVLANDCEDADVMTVATENEDGSYTVVCFNQGDTPRSVHLEGLPTDVRVELDAQALQTIVLTPSEL